MVEEERAPLALVQPPQKEEEEIMVQRPKTKPKNQYIRRATAPIPIVQAATQQEEPEPTVVRLRISAADWEAAMAT